MPVRGIHRVGLSANTEEECPDDWPISLWLYLRVSVAGFLAGMVAGFAAESPATATATTPTTSVLVPANGATLSGTAATLDGSAPNATSVEWFRPCRGIPCFLWDVL